MLPSLSFFPPFIFLRGPHSRGINQNSGLSLLSTLRLALLCLHGTGCGQGNVSSSDAGSLLGAPLEPVCELSTRSHHSYQSPQSRGGATCSTRGHGFREDGSPRDMGLVTGCTLLSDTVLALLPAPKRSSWVAASITLASQRAQESQQGVFFPPRLAEQ